MPDHSDLSFRYFFNQWSQETAGGETDGLNKELKDYILELDITLISSSLHRTTEYNTGVTQLSRD